MEIEVGKFYRTKEASIILGYADSELRRLIREGLFKGAIRIGGPTGHIRIPGAVLQRLLDEALAQLDEHAAPSLDGDDQREAGGAAE